MFSATRRALFGVMVLGDHSALQTAINQSDKRRVVAWVTATWCGPCKSIAPFIEKLANVDGSKVDFIKIDLDEHPDVAESLQVESVPTFVMYHNKEVVGRVVGASREKIEEMVRDN